MILVDYNQISIAAIFRDQKLNGEITEELSRHLILNSIRNIRMKFKDKYGEIVLCCDATDYWRKDIFPYYKAMRKKEQNESPVDWNKLFRILKLVRDEIRLVMPYRVILVPRCEADDIIYVLSKRATPEKPVIIISGDKDFVQCHNDNVKQYDSAHDKWVEVPDPKNYLDLKILKGDRGDGIPNVLSEDSALVMSERQPPMTAKRIKAITSGVYDEATGRRIARNRALIDLSQIPVKYLSEIEEAIENEKPADGKLVFDYFVIRKLNRLMDVIQQFV